ncbi:MAG TPA: hypothetical protein VMN39_10455 [Longimicrobiaceae bacterium]|nr:hypothetical protein [Longimicrobiaceae bacterium]
MLLFALTLTLLGGLTVARRLAEPACPACSAKSWKDEPPLLECNACGWASAAPTAAVAAEAPRGPA